MLGGFSFKGVHSSEYGVYETPESRVLMPQKRRTLIEIPGRSEAFIQEDGGYNSRTESIMCSYIPPENDTIGLQRRVRLIAGWLSGVGELTFDYEPEMHYNAFLSSAPPTVKQMVMQYATFELEWTCNHPFAYESAQEIRFNSLAPDTPMLLTTNGTVQTPVRIIIRNNGPNIITNLTITQKFIN